MNTQEIVYNDLDIQISQRGLLSKSMFAFLSPDSKRQV